MSKIKINKIVNLPKLTHRVFILLWIILGFALILKFCFNWLFPIAVESEAFIKLCDFIEKHIYIDYAMMYVFYMLNCNVVFLINSVKKKYKNILELILMNLLFTLGYLVKLLVGNAIGTIFKLIYINFNNVLK